MKEIILTSSALILILMALRRLLRGKLNPTFQYCLWLLVALRLLIPGSLFTAPVSIMGLLEEQQAVRTEQSLLPSETVPDTPLFLPQSPLPEIPLPDGAYWVGEVTVSDAEPGSNLSLNAQTVWYAGIALTGGILLASNGRFYLRLRRRRQRLPISRGKTPVYLVKNLPSPCLFGLLRPAIYLNEAALEPERLEHILLHEETHLRRGDHIWALVRCLCLSIHWYNPLVWRAAVLSRRDCETACDDGVIRRLGEVQRLRYGATLVGMISPSAGSILHTATTMTAEKRTMQERISLIAKRPHMLKITLAAALLVMSGAVILTFGGAADPTPAENEPPNEADTVTETVLPEASEPKPAEPVPSLPQATPAVTVSYEHPMFTLQLPENWASTVTAAVSADGVEFYLSERYDPSAGQSRLSENGWLMSIVPQPVYWTERYGLTALADSTFNCNGSAYTYVLQINGEAAQFAPEIAADLAAAAESFRLLANPSTMARLVRENRETDPALAIRYLPYLSWQAYAAAYGEDALMDLLVDLWQLAGSAELSWEQYHDLLSAPADSGIDGAYATMYQDLLWRLYERNSGQYASVVSSEYLSDAERANALRWLRWPLAEQQGRSGLLSTAEVWLALGLPLLSHSDVTLQQAGESFRLLPVFQEEGISLRYTSENPAAAAVAQDGTVTAVSPGTTRIRVIITGEGWAWEGSCLIRCIWTDEARDAALSAVETYGAFTLIEYLIGSETWNMAGLQAQLEKGFAAALAGSPLEGCLAAVTVESSFAFPASPQSGETIRVPVTLTYRVTSGGTEVTVPVTGQFCELGFYEEGGIMPEWMAQTQHNIARMEGLAAWEAEHNG